MKRLVIGSILIFLIQVGLSLVFYWGRIAKWNAIFFSDWLVFFLPNCAALFAYSINFWQCRLLCEKPTVRIIVLIAFSLVITALSFWAFMIVGFNTFGT
jgi:hypothetical protein